MKHQEYVKLCEYTEHKNMPARVRNLQSGETGVVVQCRTLSTPEGFLVDLGDELTTWSPEDVEEIKEPEKQ